MLFKKEFIIPILLGQKIVTRREKRPREGVDRVYKAQQKLFTPDYFAEFKVTGKFQQPLSEMTDKDYKDEGFRGREQFIFAWEHITKNPLDESQNVWVIEFELVRVAPDYVDLLEMLSYITVDGKILTTVDIPKPLTPEQIEEGVPEPEIPKPEVIPLVDLDQILFYYPQLAKFFPAKKIDLPTEQEKIKPKRRPTVNEIFESQQEIQAGLQELADQKVEIANESIELQKKWNALEHERRRILVNERLGRRRRRVRRQMS